MRINRIPFFLWLTNKRSDLIVDLKNNIVVGIEEGSSNIKEVPLFLIFLLKYLPFLLVLPFFYLPTTLYEAGLLTIASALIVVLFLTFEHQLVFNGILVLVCALNCYLVFTIPNYALGLDLSITFFVEALVFLSIIADIFLFKGYRNWYFIESFKNEMNIKLSQRKEKKFLFFFKKNSGINLNKKIYIKGYFLRIENEDKLV